MFEFLLKGGFFIWPIVFCSVLMIAIVFERAHCFHRARNKIPNFLEQVKLLVVDNKENEAEKFCRKTPGPVAKILGTGIHLRKRPEKDIEKNLSRIGSREIKKLDKNLRPLGIIGHITPLLGLLGTVTGMIKCFVKIQELGGRVDASVLAGGIAEALITTAAGMTVAIPAIIFYHYFEGRVDNTYAQMKDAGEELLEWLHIKNTGIAKEKRSPGEDVEYGI